MMRYAPWAMALVLSSIIGAGPAHADRRHVNVFVAVSNRPAFFNPFFHQRFFFHPFCHPFCRSNFFFRGAVFAPAPVAFYPPPVYYAPPPMYYYPPSVNYAPAPAAAAPSGVPSQDQSLNNPEDCRPYETAITIDGRPQRLVGTVCKGPDGWHTAQ